MVDMIAELQERQRRESKLLEEIECAGKLTDEQQRELEQELEWAKAEISKETETTMGSNEYKEEV